MSVDYPEIDIEGKSLDEKLDLIEAIENFDCFGEHELNALYYLSNDLEEEIRARVEEVLVFSDSQVSENILIKLLRDESVLVRGLMLVILCVIVNEFNNQFYRNRCASAKVLCDLLQENKKLIEIKTAFKQRLMGFNWKFTR